MSTTFKDLVDEIDNIYVVEDNQIHTLKILKIKELENSRVFYVEDENGVWDHYTFRDWDHYKNESRKFYNTGYIFASHDIALEHLKKLLIDENCKLIAELKFKTQRLKDIIDEKAKLEEVIEFNNKRIESNNKIINKK